MNISNNIYNYYTKNAGLIGFKAGVTNLVSDFDGTYMRPDFTHNAVCGYCELDKGAFSDYYTKFSNLLDDVKGKDSENPKLVFTISSGRNLFEINHNLKAIRERGLSVFLPDKVTTSNGGDTFNRRNLDNKGGYYNCDHHRAFLEENADQEKRNWFKKFIGWDGDVIKEDVKNFLSRKGFCIENVETTNLSYPYHKTLYGLLNEFFPKHDKHNPENHKFDNCAAFRKDGKLDIHIAFSPYRHNKYNRKDHGDRWYDEHKYKKNYIEGIYHELEKHINDTYNNGKKSVYIEPVYSDPHSKGFNKENLFAVRILPYMGKFGSPEPLKKVHYLQKEVKEMPPDDLLIVAGDTENDAEMLDLWRYVGDGSRDKSYFEDEDKMKELQKLPVIAIWIDHGQDMPDDGTGINYRNIDKYFNSDGNIRFIHVDPKNPEKPQTLKDAVELAVRKYAERNDEFRKNLSPEMRERVDELNEKEKEKK